MAHGTLHPTNSQFSSEMIDLVHILLNQVHQHVAEATVLTVLSTSSWSYNEVHPSHGINQQKRQASHFTQHSKYKPLLCIDVGNT